MSIARQQARLAIRRIISSRHASTSPPGNGAPRKPMIHFDAKTRHHESKPGLPHPMAPKGVDFKTFGKGKPAPPGQTEPKPSSQSASPSSQSSSSSSKQSSSSPSPSKPAPSSKGLPPADYEEFFEMPKRYWERPPLEESEIEAIMTGGATWIR